MFLGGGVEEQMCWPHRGVCVHFVLSVYSKDVGLSALCGLSALFSLLLGRSFCKVIRFSCRLKNAIDFACGEVGVLRTSLRDSFLWLRCSN